MKIDRISLFRVPISFGERSYQSAGSAAEDRIDGTVVRIDTDEGIAGWGEISPWGRTYLPEFAEGARAGLSLLARALIGRDPTNIAAIGQAMDAVLDGHAYIKSAFDIATWDLAGRVAGLPIYKLLGGGEPEGVPMNCAVYNGAFGDMADRIAEYREKSGYRIFSTKPCGEREADIRLYHDLARIRRSGETFIADANRVWTVTDAIRIARAIEHLGFSLEQPCPTYEECLRVRRATSAVMALDECILSGDDLGRMAKDNAAEIAHLKLSRIGGISAAARLSGFCQVAGLSVSWASPGGTEIADMAALQVAAATPRRNLFGLWSCREFNLDSFVGGAPQVRDGVMAVPDAPGLGISPREADLGKPYETIK